MENLKNGEVSKALGQEGMKDMVKDEAMKVKVADKLKQMCTIWGY